MAKLEGRIIDKTTGQTVAARVQVLSSSGQFLRPEGAILKVGPGAPFFYADGAFELAAPRGRTEILAERGTEYVPARLWVEAPTHGSVSADLLMERWSDLSERGWHPGNTHIHYDQNEKRPDERLRLDPRIEDLRFTAISVLERWNTPYASNKYTPGFLTEFSTAHHHVECGEESRHNGHDGKIDSGYGHIMLLRIQGRVEPVSRGFLVEETDPDYPPLCYACDDTHRRGGIVIWCHNGRGLEAPVAAALGKLDAFNLFDPTWMDPEYDIWYALLNCGFKLPASTGSDWYLSSANRVYAHTGGAFEYAAWMRALQQGRTFITNGPALFFTVNGAMPGDLVRAPAGGKVGIKLSWKSHYPIHRAEIIRNGSVAASWPFPDGATEGSLEHEIEIPADGWLAARLSGNVRDSFWQPIFAHTSPVYLAAGRAAPEQKLAAGQFAAAIETGIESVNTTYRFREDKHRREVADLFRAAGAVYERLK